jgi:hypothetical protein
MEGVFMQTTHIIGAVLLGLTLAACHKEDDKRLNEGPAERAGREIDQATAKAAVELDKAATHAEHNINKAAEVIGEKLEKAGEKVQESAREARTEEEAKKAK